MDVHERLRKLRHDQALDEALLNVVRENKPVPVSTKRTEPLGSLDEARLLPHLRTRQKNGGPRKVA